MLLRLFHALMPKEEKFIDHFCAHSKKIVAAADALHALMIEPDDAPRHRRTIYHNEGEADRITRDTLLAIHRTFITPFDRADIHGLITAMDDTIDLIEETAQRTELYEVSDFTTEMKEMAESAQKCAIIIHDTVPLLGAISKNSDLISKQCIEVSKIEGHADRKLRKGLSELIKSGRDPIAVMTRKEIYESLESIIDRCDDVMNVIQGIVIEHV
ncbi:putative pit accessory protein [uncultured Gammaproteobacteria bacterium]